MAKQGGGKVLNFYHGEFFSPKLSTGCKAIKNGFIQYWPVLTVNQVTKYNPISEATVKSHMNSQQSNIYSTKNKPLKKTWTLTYQHPVPLIVFPKTKNSMMLYPVTTQ